MGKNVISGEGTKPVLPLRQGLIYQLTDSLHNCLFLCLLSLTDLYFFYLFLTSVFLCFAPDSVKCPYGIIEVFIIIFKSLLFAKTNSKIF